MDESPGRFRPPPESGPPPWSQPPPFPPAQPGPALAPRAYPLDVSRVFELTLSLFRYRWRTFLAVVLVVMLPSAVLLALVQLITGPEVSRWTEAIQRQALEGRFDLMAGFPWQAVALGFLGSILAGTFGYTAEAAVVDAASVTYTGGQPTAAGSIGRTVSRLRTIVGTYLLVEAATLGIMVGGVAIAIGTALILGGGDAFGPGLPVLAALIVGVAALAALIFVSLRWALAVQAIVLERARAVHALRRSWRLVAGSTWRVLGYALLFGLLFGLIAVLISTVVTFFVAPELVAPRLGAAFDPVRIAIAGFISSLVGSAVLPFPAIGFTLLYFDLRFRRGESVPQPGGQQPATESGSVAE